MRLLRYRKPSLKSVLGITSAKKRVRRQLGITALLKPFRAYGNAKRRVKRRLGYYSTPAKVVRNGLPSPFGVGQSGPQRRRSFQSTGCLGPVLLLAMVVGGVTCFSDPSRPRFSQTTPESSASQPGRWLSPPNEGSAEPRQTKELEQAAVPLIPSNVDLAEPEDIAPQPTATKATQVLLGNVKGVADGDTITLLDAERNQHKVRLEGIDTPESHQAFGRQARKALAEKVFQKDVRVLWRAKDRYGRILGHVYVDKRWVNKELIEGGWAWHYKHYNSDERLAAAETKAKEQKIGLWRDEKPIPPWDFRRQPKTEKAATKKTLTSASEFEAPNSARAKRAAQRNAKDRLERQQVLQARDRIVYVTRTGEKYHRDGCQYLAKSKIPIPLSEAQQRYDACSRCDP